MKGKSSIMLKKYGRFLLTFCLMLLVAFSMAACFESGGGGDKELSSIVIKTSPIKTTYLVNESLDLTGGVISAIYSDQTKEDVPMTSDKVEVDGYSKTKTGTQNLTVKYGGKTTSFAVTVVAPSVYSLSISVMPSKTEYNIGDSLDLTGGKLLAIYNDGKNEEVNMTSSAVTKSAFSSSTAGNKAITLTYDNRSCVLNVLVCAPLSSLDTSKIDELPDMGFQSPDAAKDLTKEQTDSAKNALEVLSNLSSSDRDEVDLETVQKIVNINLAIDAVAVGEIVYPAIEIVSDFTNKEFSAPNKLLESAAALKAAAEQMEGLVNKYQDVASSFGASVEVASGMTLEQYTENVEMQKYELMAMAEGFIVSDTIQNNLQKGTLPASKDDIKQSNVATFEPAMVPLLQALLSEDMVKNASLQVAHEISASNNEGFDLSEVMDSYTKAFVGDEGYGIVMLIANINNINNISNAVPRNSKLGDTIEPISEKEVQFLLYANIISRLNGEASASNRANLEKIAPARVEKIRQEYDFIVNREMYQKSDKYRQIFNEAMELCAEYAYEYFMGQITENDPNYTNFIKSCDEFVEKYEKEPIFAEITQRFAPLVELITEAYEEVNENGGGDKPVNPGPIDRLQPPKNLRVEGDLLIWDIVEGANSYVIIFTDFMYITDTIEVKSNKYPMQSFANGCLEVAIYSVNEKGDRSEETYFRPLADKWINLHYENGDKPRVDLENVAKTALYWNNYYDSDFTQRISFNQLLTLQDNDTIYVKVKDFKINMIGERELQINPQEISNYASLYNLYKDSGRKNLYNFAELCDITATINIYYTHQTLHIFGDFEGAFSKEALLEYNTAYDFYVDSEYKERRDVFYAKDGSTLYAKERVPINVIINGVASQVYFDNFHQYFWSYFIYEDAAFTKRVLENNMHDYIDGGTVYAIKASNVIVRTNIIKTEKVSAVTLERMIQHTDYYTDKDFTKKLTSAQIPSLQEGATLYVKSNIYEMKITVDKNKGEEFWIKQVDSLINNYNLYSDEKCTKLLDRNQLLALANGTVIFGVDKYAIYVTVHYNGDVESIKLSDITSVMYTFSFYSDAEYKNQLEYNQIYNLQQNDVVYATKIPTVTVFGYRGNEGSTEVTVQELINQRDNKLYWDVARTNQLTREEIEGLVDGMTVYAEPIDMTVIIAYGALDMEISLSDISNYIDEYAFFVIREENNWEHVTHFNGGQSYFAVKRVTINVINEHYEQKERQEDIIELIISSFGTTTYYTSPSYAQALDINDIVALSEGATVYELMYLHYSINILGDLNKTVLADELQDISNSYDFYLDSQMTQAFWIGNLYLLKNGDTLYVKKFSRVNIYTLTLDVIVESRVAAVKYLQGDMTYNYYYDINLTNPISRENLANLNDGDTIYAVYSNINAYMPVEAFKADADKLLQTYDFYKDSLLTKKVNSVADVAGMNDMDMLYGVDKNDNVIVIYNSVTYKYKQYQLNNVFSYYEFYSDINLTNKVDFVESGMTVYALGLPFLHFVIDGQISVMSIEDISGSHYKTAYNFFRDKELTILIAHEDLGTLDRAAMVYAVENPYIYIDFGDYPYKYYYPDLHEDLLKINYLYSDSAKTKPITSFEQLLNIEPFATVYATRKPSVYVAYDYGDTWYFSIGDLEVIMQDNVLYFDVDYTQRIYKGDIDNLVEGQTIYAISKHGIKLEVVFEDKPSEVMSKQDINNYVLAYYTYLLYQDQDRTQPIYDYNMLLDCEGTIYAFKAPYVYANEFFLYDKYVPVSKYLMDFDLSIIYADYEQTQILSKQDLFNLNEGDKIYVIKAYFNIALVVEHYEKEGLQDLVNEYDLFYDMFLTQPIDDIFSVDPSAIIYGTFKSSVMVTVKIGDKTVRINYAQLTDYISIVSFYDDADFNDYNDLNNLTKDSVLYAKVRDYVNIIGNNVHLLPLQRLWTVKL